MNLVSSRNFFSFFIVDYVIFQRVLFPLSRDFLAYSERLVLVYIKRRGFYDLVSGIVLEKRSLLICGDSLWISVSVASG